MRTIVDIPKEKLLILTELAQQRHASRAQLIREAIDALLAMQEAKNLISNDAFGILKKSGKIDGLALQEKLRSDWE